MLPTPGTIVLYRLSQADWHAIQQLLTAHGGNAVRPGDDYPALIVRAFGHPDSPSQPVNLQVFLDGPLTYWATSRLEGEEDGQWRFRGSDEHAADQAAIDHGMSAFLAHQP